MRHSNTSALIFLTLFFSISSGLPQNQQPDATPVPAVSGEESLRNTVIDSSPSFDWIMINSGEWLKGRVKSMLDDKLEFDSDELDIQSFDWEDVYFLYSPKLNGVRTEEKTTDYGTLWIDRTNITVTSGITNQYPRNTVLGIAPGGPKERNYWSGNISVGFSIRSGNVNQTDFNSSAGLKRITPATRLALDYLGNYSEVDNLENANNHRVSLSFDVFLSKRLFVRTPFAEYYRDPFQNIQGRTTIGAGLGYDILDRSKVDWSVTAGPAYQTLRYISVLPGEDIKRNTPAAVLSTDLDWDITSKLELIFQFSTQISSTDAGGVTSHLLTKFEYEVTKILDIETSFILDRTSRPQQDQNGVTPKKNDVRLVFGLGLEF